MNGSCRRIEKDNDVNVNEVKTKSIALAHEYSGVFVQEAGDFAHWDFMVGTRTSLVVGLY